VNKKNRKINRLAFSILFVDSSHMDTKLLLGLLLRHGLTIAGGYATGAGIVSQADLQTGIGAAVALVGIVMSALEKRKRVK
jgi:hypothetical protein